MQSLFKLSFLCCLLSGSLILGCGKVAEKSVKEINAVTKEKVAEKFFVIETTVGEIVLEVYPKKTPVTVSNFIKYVDNGTFDGATFYRAVRMDNQARDSIKIEVIQGNFVAYNLSLGPIEHETTEHTGILHQNGTISMARTTPGTASVAFFICINDQPELDFGGKRNPDGQGFAAFGKVVKGMDIVKKIQSVETDGQSLKMPIAIDKIKKWKKSLD